jgi:hypothetical protein
VASRQLVVSAGDLEACVSVRGRWVPADASNSRRPAPLLEEAQPRSGDKAGCNSQVAVDPALL